MRSDNTREEGRDEGASEAPVPFALGVVPWRQDGALSVTVVVKATFSARTSPMTPAKAPEPYRVMDVHHRNQPMARVVGASDRAPRKRAVDVTVLGHARAKGGAPVSEMSARIALVQGGAAVIDKTVRVVGARAAKDAKPLPFVEMPITYERAYGGLATPANPIGCGEDDADDDGQPNILDPSDASRPAGFGPISSAWPIRKKRLGAAAPRDVESALITLPSAFDLAYFQCAPDDQQAPELAPDAVLVVEGLHAETERVELALPGARAFGAVYGLDPSDPDAPTPIELRADTLHLDADAWVATITFRGSVRIDDESGLDRLVVATGVGLGGREPAIPARRPGAEHIRPAASLTADAKAADQASLGGTLVLAPVEAPAITALPFQPSGSPPRARGASSDTLVLPLSSWSSGPPRDLCLATLAFHEEPAVAQPLLPSTPVLSPPALLPVAEVPLPASAELSAPPPALVSPIASREEAEKKPSEATIDLERYAAICAAIAEPQAKLADILKQSGVSMAAWRSADKRWRVELGREAKAGGRATRDDYDDAFVRAWEAAKPGRFGVRDYVRLAAAEKRARLASEITAMGLDAALAMRLRRVWRRRAAADESIRREIDEQSAGGGAARAAGES